MKRFGMLMVAGLLSFPAFAGSLQVEEIPEGRTWAMRVLRQAREAQRESGYRPNAIASNRSARALVIPVAGNSPGAHGTHFRSDVTIANWNENEQRIGIMWLPNGEPNGVRTFRIRVRGRNPITFRDFIGTELGLFGAGTLIMLPISGTGDFDEHGAIDAYSRIWTPQPNASGTVSQPFPAVEREFMTEERKAVVLGLRQDTNFRTNFGLVNISEDELKFNVTVVPEEGETRTQTVTLPSLSMIQTGIPAGNHGQLSLRVDVDESVPNFEFTWIAYASSTDNITGDGWVSIGANPWTDEELTERGH